jgi:hypothetical protein
MSKIVQKHIVNSINTSFIRTIKQHFNSNAFMNYSMEQLICTHEIYGKKVDFYLKFIKIPSGSFNYQIGAFYYFRQQKNRNYKIEITLSINDGFSEKLFSEIYFRIKACLIHEIEHHLQKLKAPTREFLPRKNYKDIADYINMPSELEAISKHLYFLHKKTGINFSKLILEESSIISDDENLQDIFISKITNYLIKRKDLNLFKNIKF